MGLYEEECLNSWEEIHYCKKHDEYYEKHCFYCKHKIKPRVTPLRTSHNPKLPQ